MNQLTGILYTLSNLLLVPVVVALLLFLAWAIILLGGFFNELLTRRNVRITLTTCANAARKEKQFSRLLQQLRKCNSGPVTVFCNRINPTQCDPETMRHVLSLVEHEIAAVLARLSFLTRAGPMFGLMGTLIPLGPALMGLSSGNTQALGQNLVVSFTTTVIGVLVGIIAFGIGLVRRSWYSHDLDDLELICDRLLKPNDGAKHGA